MFFKIKFRAWWKEAKLMADVEVWRESDIVIIVPVVSSIPGHKFERQFLDAGEYNLMQYSTLFDSNGKEIFEGDIVKVNSKNKKGVEKEVIAPVVFYHGHFMLVKSKTNKKWRSLGDIKNKDNLTVIGDIYQTPELLN